MIVIEITNKYCLLARKVNFGQFPLVNFIFSSSYIATKLNCLKYIAETIQMISNQADNGSMFVLLLIQP